MTSASPLTDQPLQLAGLYGRLMTHAAGLPNDELFAKMLASQALGAGALPTGLGLTPQAFARLLVRHFPHSGPLLELDQAQWSCESRMDERQDLLDLLVEHRAGTDESEVWMASIVTAACMGGDHLWQDLGLWSRRDLTRLMGDNFPLLSAKNVHDMKWKKFLYKQLCQREGVYVCRSPSCEVCADYANCFGPEE
jgi:nitrogen fixation protein NifQ